MRQSLERVRRPPFPTSTATPRFRPGRVHLTGVTALELARIQFGLTISFHIIFPALSIGLAGYLEVLELGGTLFVLPFVLGYSCFSYDVLRGKVKLVQGYR